MNEDRKQRIAKLLDEAQRLKDEREFGPASRAYERETFPAAFERVAADLIRPVFRDFAGEINHGGWRVGVDEPVFMKTAESYTGITRYFGPAEPTAFFSQAIGSTHTPHWGQPRFSIRPDRMAMTLLPVSGYPDREVVGQPMKLTELNRERIEGLLEAFLESLVRADAQRQTAAA